MNNNVLALGLLMVGLEWSCGDSPPSSAADRITLRDGSVVLGVVNATTPGPRGAVEFLVRREWAEKALKSARRAGTVRRQRMCDRQWSSGGKGCRHGGLIEHRMWRRAIVS